MISSDLQRKVLRIIAQTGLISPIVIKQKLQLTEAKITEIIDFLVIQGLLSPESDSTSPGPSKKNSQSILSIHTSNLTHHFISETKTKTQKKDTLCSAGCKECPINDGSSEKDLQKNFKITEKGRLFLNQTS